MDVMCPAWRGVAGRGAEWRGVAWKRFEARCRRAGGRALSNHVSNRHFVEVLSIARGRNPLNVIPCDAAVFCEWVSRIRFGLAYGEQKPRAREIFTDKFENVSR